MEYPQTIDYRSDSRFVQFQLWRECSNNCKFCFNKGLSNINKEWILTQVINKIKEPLIDKFNEFGFIGGELFNKQISEPIVNKLFFELIQICVDKIKTNKLKTVYITSALFYKDLSELFQFLDYIESRGVIDKFILCTSYDTKYRFHNQNGISIWTNNMDEVHKKYPKLRVHVETILTEDFVCKVLSSEFNIKAFQERFSTKMNFICPQCNIPVISKEDFDKLLPGFLIKRKTFLKFLHKVYNENIIDIRELLNESLHSDLLYVECNGHLYEFIGRRRFPTLLDAYYANVSSDVNFKIGYIDSNIRMEDDVKEFCRVMIN